MKCAIPTVPTKYLDISASPEIGVETTLLYSLAEIQTLATIEQDAVDSGVLSAGLTYQPPANPTKGLDLQMTALNAIVSDQPVVVAFATGFDDGTTGSGIATFLPPATAADRSANLPVGIAVDVKLYCAGVDVTATRTVRTVTGLLSISGGDVGNKFGVVAVPDRSTFTLIANVNNRDVVAPVGKSVNVPSGYNGARWIKRGRSEPPKLDIKANYTGFGDGLPRMAGQRVTIMMETRKDDRVLTERMFVGGWRPDVKVAKPDGNSLSEATATGEFESGSFAVFV